MNLDLAKIRYRKNWKPRRPFMQSAGAPAQLQTNPDIMAHSMRLASLRKNNFKRHQDYENQLQLADKKEDIKPEKPRRVNMIVYYLQARMVYYKLGLKKGCKT